VWAGWGGYRFLVYLKDKEALEFFVEVVVKAAEHILDVLDEMEDEELKEAYRLIVGLTTVFRSRGSTLRSSHTGKPKLVGGLKPEALKQPRPTAS
jgi:hypothetical protein